MALFFLIVHVVASLAVVVLAVYLVILALHKASLMHRIDRMTQRMRPLIVGRGAKKHVVDVLVLDGFPKEEAEELYDKLSEELLPRRE